ncbi:ABC transporter substrate-binding protein [Wenzhouxiangellaceae bacterium CH-27]|uniref:ABC transporter substrate-binding protein n=1 Tax=Elongatibacter sediminis TaxID=3119006 RepID=A0AAW9R5U9_9GAMM
MSACEPQSPDLDTGPQPTVYRHSMDGAPTSLDPAHASSIYANFLVVNLFDTLYRYRYLARPYELVPNLAESLPEVSADGLIHTIRIKPGVRFIDDPAFPNGKGRVVRAADVVYSIKRHFDPATRSQGSWLWRGRIVGLDEWSEQGADYDREVAGLRALDDRTLQIQLIAPYPQLTHTLAQGFSAVVPAEAVEYHEAALGIHPVGSGPYRLARFDSTGATLIRNTGFRTEPFSLEAEGYDSSTQGGFGLESLEGEVPPFADRVEVAFITEDAARWSTFNAGESHFVKAPVTQFDQILASRNPPTLRAEYAERYHLLANLESGFVHTDFNMNDPRIGYHPDPDQNVRNRALRCAIVKAFDWERRNEVFFSGLGRVFPGIIPPVTPEYQPPGADDPTTRDVLGAISLLKRNGWHAGNLPELEYGFTSSVTERQMFEQFRSFMADIGYPAERIRPLTFASYGDYARAYSNREVMLINSSWTMDYPDAQNTMQLFYGPNAAPGSNVANYENGEFDRLYQTGASMPPSPLRTTLYQKMNRLVIGDCATISGISRTLVLLWDREWRMLPDRSFVGGYFVRFAAPPATPEAKETNP